MPYKDPEAQREYQRIWMAARRAEALEGRTCAFCTSTAGLEFHHFDREAKVSHRVWSWTKERRDAELAKCILLCHACHTRRHREERRFCRRGHEFTPQNTYISPSKGRRECAICRGSRKRAYNRARYAAQKAAA